jgi:hypothetical protein
MYLSVEGQERAVTDTTGNHIDAVSNEVEVWEMKPASRNLHSSGCHHLPTKWLSRRGERRPAKSNTAPCSLSIALPLQNKTEIRDKNNVKVDIMD